MACIALMGVFSMFCMQTPSLFTKSRSSQRAPSNVDETIHFDHLHVI